MKRAILLRDLAKAIDVSRHRIEQAISREQFLPNIWSESGKPREWTFGEAMRLALFFTLVDRVGMDVKAAGALTQIDVHGFNDQPAYFVAHHLEYAANAWGRKIVRASDLGAYLTSGCEYPKILAPGRDAAAIAASSKKDLRSARQAIVIDLDAIEDGLRRVWPRGESA